VTFPLRTGPVRSREIWQNNLVNRMYFAMKESKYTEEQIAYALRQAETGTKVWRYTGRWG